MSDAPKKRIDIEVGRTVTDGRESNGRPWVRVSSHGAWVAFTYDEWQAVKRAADGLLAPFVDASEADGGVRDA